MNFRRPWNEDDVQDAWITVIESFKRKPQTKREKWGLWEAWVIVVVDTAFVAFILFAIVGVIVALVKG